MVTQKVTKTTCLNNKTQPIFDDKDRLLTEAKKIAYLSNSVPKNNEKNNKEKKYPHNNHKINNTFIKTIKNISKYNTIENNKKKKRKNFSSNKPHIKPQEKKDIIIDIKNSLFSFDDLKDSEKNQILQLNRNKKSNIVKKNV